jgi:hypothetical protein
VEVVRVLREDPVGLDAIARGTYHSANNAGIAHENGEVEQAHRHFKDAVAQALRVRAVKISFPMIVAPTLPPYNASPIKEGTQHVIEARLFEFGSSSKVLFPNPQCSFYQTAP